MIEAAYRGMGTDEKKVIDAVAPASNAALVQACIEYNRLFHKDLIAETKRETSGNFEDGLVALLTQQSVLDARNCQKAMRGLGTDEDRLDEILLFRTAPQIDEIKRAFLAEFKKDLVAEVRSETSGHLQAIYVACLTNRTPFRDFKQAADMADELYRAGEGKTGTDNGVFARIFGSAEPLLLENIGRVYIMKYQKSLSEVCKSEFDFTDRKDFRRCCQNALDGYGRFLGKRLVKSMRGLGTDDGMLIRLIVSHRASGALYGANEYLIDSTQKSLVAWIKDETSGDYRTLLVALCRAVGV